MTEATPLRKHEAATELRWIRTQAASGMTFSVFLAIHLANNLLGSAGPATYAAFQAGARAFYQNPFFEFVVVLIPLVVHMLASIVRIVRRRRRNLPRGKCVGCAG